MNSVVLIGRLARDVEVSYTPNTQMAVAKFTLAVDRPRTKDGEEQPADFIRITVFGRQGENCGKYLAKGRQAAVQGRIQTGSYKNKDGATVYTTDVIADRVEFLGGGSSAQGGSATNRNVSTAHQSDQVGMEEAFDDLPDTFQAAEDDIPF